MGIKQHIKSLFVRKIVEPIYVPLIKTQYLANKVVLITGGNKGIGYAIAETCINCGASVIISGRDSEKLSNAVKNLIKKTGCDDCKLKYSVLDILDVKKFPLFLEETANIFNEIDILVNNAGISGETSIGQTTEENFDSILDTNLKGTYFLAQAFANYLIQNHIHGNILNVSSSSSNRPIISPYMLSKWGVSGLTEGLAKKFIKYDIVVNAIAPGPTATDMLKRNKDSLAYEGSPSKRINDVYEVANLAVILISDIGRMIVGETVYVTGGCGTLTFDDIEY